MGEEASFEGGLRLAFGGKQHDRTCAVGCDLACHCIFKPLHKFGDKLLQQRVVGGEDADGGGDEDCASEEGVLLAW